MRQKCGITRPHFHRTPFPPVRQKYTASSPDPAINRGGWALSRSSCVLCYKSKGARGGRASASLPPRLRLPATCTFPVNVHAHLRTPARKPVCRRAYAPLSPLQNARNDAEPAKRCTGGDGPAVGAGPRPTDAGQGTRLDVTLPRKASVAPAPEFRSLHDAAAPRPRARHQDPPSPGRQRSW